MHASEPLSQSKKRSFFFFFFRLMEEKGECSSSASANLSDEIWAKFVSLDERYSDVEISSDEKVVFSVISVTSNGKHSWCKIVRNPDLCSATLENKSQNTILVDGAEVHSDESIVIKDGSQIILDHDREEFVSYRFHRMSSPNICQRQLKICVDVDHAKCSICLNPWHDVVTVAPCLHNFCNGCFSEWLRRSKQRHSAILCPQCRAVVQFVGKNPFLRTIAEDMLRADPSLRCSHDEVALLDTYALVRSNLMSWNGTYWFDTETSEMCRNQRSRRRHACCECGGRVKVYTSRSIRNPGRRFLGCPNYRYAWGCGFFYWIDDPISDGAEETVEGQQWLVADMMNTNWFYMLLSLCSCSLTIIVVVFAAFVVESV